MVVTINCREQKHQKNNYPYFIMFCNKFRCSVKTWNQSFMSGLFDCFVEEKDHSRKYCYTTDDSDYNTFRHYDTHITTKCKGHYTKCKETCNSSYRTAGYGFEGVCNGMSHGSVFVFVFLFVCFKGVQKKNGIVHGNPQLKHCCQGFCDITNTSQENIGSKVIKNRQTYT